MRILGEITDTAYKITVFKTDSRLLLKFEDAFLEQTYKFRESEELQNMTDIRRLLTADFMQAVQQTFALMYHTHYTALTEHLQVDAEELPTII